MRQFGKGNIYTVQPDATVGMRDGRVTIEDDGFTGDVEDLQRPLQVDGLESTDLALLIDFRLSHFTSNLPAAKRTLKLGFLVTSYDEGHGIVVPEEAVSANPRLWMSPHLHRALAGLPFGEVEQLGLGALHTYATVEPIPGE